MLNAQEVIAEINKLLQETTSGSGHWSASDLLSRANMFHDELSLDVPELLITIDETLVTIAGTRLYTMPDTVGLVLSVKVNGKPIAKSSYNGMDIMSASGRIDAQWQSYSGGEASHWYLENNKLGIYPTPVTAGLTITIVAELMLTAMTNSASSYPFQNYAFLKVAQRWLILKVASMCAGEDGDDAKTQTWDAQAEVLIGKIRDKMTIMRGVATDINASQEVEGDPE